MLFIAVGIHHTDHFQIMSTREMNLASPVNNFPFTFVKHYSLTKANPSLQSMEVLLKHINVHQSLRTMISILTYSACLWMPECVEAWFCFKQTQIAFTSRSDNMWPEH